MLGKYKHKFTFINALASKINVNPNYITLFSLVPAAVACYFLYVNELVFAGIMIFLNGFLDYLDGAVARIHNRVTLRGELLDAVVDKYSECIILIFLTFVNIPSILIFMTIIGVLMTTYVQSRVGEAVGKKKSFSGVGLERSERVVLLGFGCLLSVFLSDILFYITLFIAIFSNLTALQRFIKGWKMLK
jgi:archaetidylinositol phosphate synthase